jgi:trypsin
MRKCVLSYVGNVIVAGWGALTEGGGSPSVLYKVTVPMVTTSSCKNSYGSSEILTGMICAGTGGKDSCQGKLFIIDDT